MAGLLLRPSRLRSSSFVRKFSYYNAFAFQELNKYASNDPNKFWLEKSHTIPWFKKPELDNVLDSKDQPFFRWFPDTELNTSYCCLDHHVLSGRGDQVALIHHNSYSSDKSQETTKLTYTELLDQVSRFAGALSEQGVTKGDRVIIYMPMVPEAVVAMLACARLGAVHSVVFGGFAAKELSARIKDAEPAAIVIASYGQEPGKVIHYRPLLKGALDIINNEEISKGNSSADKEKIASHWDVNQVPCFVFNRPNLSQHQPEEKESKMLDGEIDMMQAIQDSAPHEAVVVKGTDPLYVLYTSGTTGAPKGVVRDNAGHAVALKNTMDSIYACDPGSVYFSASDIGWVVGHSYVVYGPLLQGCTSVIFEGKPVGTPDAGEYWRVVEKYKVDTLFTAPTALRAIKQIDPELGSARKHDISSLKAMFVAGERADPPTVDFFTDKLSKPVIDHWWQTETGSAITALPLGLIPQPSILDQGRTSIPVKYGSSSFAVPGYHVVCLNNETGKEVEAGELGQLAIKLPMPPGTLPFLYKSKERYFSSYLEKFEGYYDCGDAGHIDKEGYVYVMSRTDDVINVAGHRLSTGQMEEVLQGHDCIAECCVVGVNDPIKGMVPVGLVVPNNGTNQQELDLLPKHCVDLIREQVGPVATFKLCFTVDALPKTRSGKILRRTVKAILDGDPNPPVPPTIDNIDVLKNIHTVAERLLQLAK